MIIKTSRTKLRCWKNSDRDAFANLHADPEVMSDYGELLDRSQSDEKFDHYVLAFERGGFCRWALEDLHGDFLGYVGIMPQKGNHSIGPHVDIGWRLKRSAWGRGYATEAAQAVLDDAFTRCRLTEVFAYTATDNLRSQAVMERLNLRRAPLRDFIEAHSLGTWHALVWVAKFTSAKGYV